MNTPKGGFWHLYHIYVGTQYQGCIEGRNPVHAVSMWAKSVQQSQLIFRAERARNGTR